jgi:hypothetical protein
MWNSDARQLHKTSFVCTIYTDRRMVNLHMKSRFTDQCYKEHKHVLPFSYTSSYGASLELSVALNQEAGQHMCGINCRYYKLT